MKIRDMKIKGMKIKVNAPVMLGFLAACLAATILNAVTGGRSNSLLFSTWHSSLASPLTYVRMFTHVIGHADFGHFIGNASYLLLIGPMLEEKYGGKRLIQVMLITAAVTGIINYIFFWNTALCGASGVVFALILLTSFTDFDDGEIPLTFILVVIVFLGQQVYEGITVRDNISNLSHIIGGVVGGAAGFWLRKKLRAKKAEY